MPIMPFGEFLPDGPAFGNPGTVTATNVVPRTANSYTAMKSPVPFSNALPSQVCGSYGYRDAAETVWNFCGTQTDLYLQRTGSPNFNPVSGPSAPYTTDAPPDGFWSMTSFGTRIIATNYEDTVQTFDTKTDTKFSDLSSSIYMPRAKFAAVIRDFLMLGNLVDEADGPVQYRLAWPAIGDPTNWPQPGTNEAIELQSDYQDLVQTDLGAITQVVGGELSAADGAAFCERGIYRIQYAGSPNIFSFQIAEGSAGTDSPLSVINRRLIDSSGIAHAVIYYLSTDGFCAFDGSSSASIGGQKVDRFFFNDVDVNFLRNVQGTFDPTRRLVMWLYHGQQNNGFYNRCLIYNWELSRWAFIDLTPIPVEWASAISYSSVGYTLDELDVFGPLDSLKYSLDSSVWTMGNPLIGWFDTNHVQNFLTGDSLPIQIATTEAQLFPDRRSRIISARPIHDALVPASVAVGTRETIRQTVVYQGAVPENILGACPQRSTGRYTRFLLTLPAAANPTFLQGIDVQARPEGRSR